MGKAGTATVGAIAVVAAVSASVALSAAPKGPHVGKCAVFPRSSHWNKRVDKLPLHPRSAAMVSAVGRDEHSHADFGSGTYAGGPIGIPYRTVSKHRSACT